MGLLDGKTAMITGGASGIGAGTVRRFVEEGARVLIADIQREVGAELARSLGDAGAFAYCNVAKEADVAGAVAETVDRFGRLDVLYNNAGFIGVSGPFETTSVEDYDKTMDVLLKSVFLGIKHASPIMKRQESGSIISTASVCGLTPDIGNHLYNVAKAGVIMMTKSAALELAEHNVRVNCICPGYIATQLMAGRPLSEIDAAENAQRLDKARERMGLSQPLKRVGEVDDIASTALFLASDLSEWVTGTAHVVDGGLTLGKPWRKQPAAVTTARPIGIYRVDD
ncbi:MAG: SDR family NAD(P)-dependent oxidoreductase [Acidimicrobiales bacterium]